MGPIAFDAGTIESTLDLNRTPFNQGLNKAEKDARAFESKKFKAKIDIDIDQRQVDRDINRTTSKRPKMQIDAEIDQKKVAKQIDAIADNTEKTAARSGNRIARALLNPMVIQLALLPGLAAISAAGVGAAFAVPVAVFGAWGIAALKSTSAVKTAWLGLKKEFVQGSREIAMPMQKDIVGTIDDLKSSFVGAKPVLTSMFKEAGPFVRQFSSSLTNMVFQTLPGMMVALGRGKGIMEGWDTLLDRMGVGLGNFFDEATRTENAADALGDLGVTIEQIATFVGQLVAKFTDAWSVIGGPFNSTLQQLFDLVVQFSSGALPTMTGGLSLLLGILQAVMGVLGPFAGILGSGVGTILAAAAAYKLLGAAVGGIGRAGGAIKQFGTSAAQNLQKFGAATGLVSTGAQKMNKDVDTSGAKISKLSRITGTVSNVLSRVGNAIPVFGAILVGAGAIVQAFQEEDARKLQEWADKREMAINKVKAAQQAVADAQEKFNKVQYDFGSSSSIAQRASEDLARATLAEKEAQDQAAKATQTHAQRLMELFDTMLGGLGKQVAYNNSVKDVKTKQDELAEAVKKTGKNSMDTKFAADELSLAMGNQVKAAGDLAYANSFGASEYDRLNLAQQASAREALNLISIFGTQAPPALYATAAGLSDAELKAMGATRSFDASGNAIITLNGKKIVINSNFVEQSKQAGDLTEKVNSLPTGTKFLTYFIKTVTEGGSNIPKPGGPPIPLIPQNAGGTSWWRGGVTTVDEHGPELIQLPSGAKVFTNRSTQLMLERMMVNIASQVRGSDGMNPNQIVAAVGAGVASAMNGIRINFDPQGVARITNMQNIRNGRR